MEQKANITQLLPMVLVFVLFYFLLIKPQQKKAKEQKEMLDNLKVGDEVILSSGLIGVIDEVVDGKNYIFVKFNDKDNPVRVFKNAIQDKYVEEVKEQTNNKKRKNK